MGITAEGWKNKNGTSNRSCSCGSWKDHWLTCTGLSWPTTCSLKGCSSSATLGAHVINASVVGEHIIPACSSCNKLTGEFNLKGGIRLASANKSETCDA